MKTRTEKQVIQVAENNGGRPIAIDLFCGVGGLSLGFEQAGFDVVAAIELDPIHAACHDFNFPHCRTICGDASKLSAKDIRKLAGLGNRCIDVVCGGAPCQGFSMIGKRALDDPRNRLVGHFVRLVTELKAKYFLFENVKGLTLGSHRKFLNELISEFESAGYNVMQPYRVLNAVSFGVPQHRERLILFGARKGLPLPSYPQATAQQLTPGEHALLLPATPTILEAIGDLPEVEEFDSLLSSDNIQATFKRASRYAAILRGIKHDPTDFSYPRQFNNDILTASLRAKHTELSRQRFAATAFGNTEPISRFHKLDPQGVSNTLRAGTASDRGAFTSPRPIHPFTARCITVREAARIHSYPDWFRFHVTKWHGFRQIGNSVPPLLARAVASSIIGALGVTPLKPAVTLDLGEASLLAFNMAQAAKHYGVARNVIAQRTRTNAPKLKLIAA